MRTDMALLRRQRRRIQWQTYLWSLALGLKARCRGETIPTRLITHSGGREADRV